jgi:hypothetical protein
MSIRLPNKPAARKRDKRAQIPPNTPVSKLRLVFLLPAELLMNFCSLHGAPPTPAHIAQPLPFVRPSRENRPRRTRSQAQTNRRAREAAQRATQLSLTLPSLALAPAAQPPSPPRAPLLTAASTALARPSREN